MEKKDINDVEKKGFRKKWWQDHRASACKGSGVGKALDALQALGMDAKGWPKGIEPKDAAKSCQLYTNLLSAFLKATNKCGGGQKETKEALQGYRKRANDALDVAEKMAQNYTKDYDDIKKLEQMTKHVDKKLEDISNMASEADSAITRIKIRVQDYRKKAQEPGDNSRQVFDKYIDQLVTYHRLPIFKKSIDGPLKNTLAQMINVIKKIKPTKTTQADYSKAMKSIQKMSINLKDVKKKIDLALLTAKTAMAKIADMSPEGR